MHDPWLPPLIITVKVIWCLMAALTLVECIRVWLPMRYAARVSVRRTSDPILRAWLWVPVRVAGGLAAVAALNLAAGLVVLSTPLRPEVWLGLGGWPAWASVAVPTLFIASALVKLYVASNLHKGYRRVVSVRMGREARS